MTTFRHARSSSIGFAVALCLVILALAASPAQARRRSPPPTSRGTSSASTATTSTSARTTSRSARASATRGTRPPWTSRRPTSGTRSTRTSTCAPGRRRPCRCPGADRPRTAGRVHRLLLRGRDHARPGRLRHQARAITSPSPPTAGRPPAAPRVPREVYVEHIISQSRNYGDSTCRSGRPASVPSFRSPPAATMTLLVGEHYEIKLVGYHGDERLRADRDLHQLPEHHLPDPGQSRPPTPPSLRRHMDPALRHALRRRLRLGRRPAEPELPLLPVDVGKAGGDITVTYRVQILSVPSSPLLNPEPLSTLVHDFSGSSYHYNADYGVHDALRLHPGPDDARPSTKSFVPTHDHAEWHLDADDPDSEPDAGPAHRRELHRSAPDLSGGTMVVAATACGDDERLRLRRPSRRQQGPRASPFRTARSEPNTTCTVTVTVTAPTAGTYTNTTGNLFINGTTPAPAPTPASQRCLDTSGRRSRLHERNQLARWPWRSTASNPSRPRSMPSGATRLRAPQPRSRNLAAPARLTAGNTGYVRRSGLEASATSGCLARSGLSKLPALQRTWSSRSTPRTSLASR